MRWVAGGLLVAALAAAAWWGFSRSQQPGVSYRTAKIERGSLQAAVSASGTVTPVTQVQVSSQVSGQIKELFVDFNSLVKQGQLIAQLDPETFDYRVRQSTADLEAARASVLTAQANVQSALAQVARAQVDVAEAQRDEQRKLDLVAQNFISSAELDTAKAKLQSANESLKVMNAQVDVARAQALTAVAVVRQRDAQLQQARVDLERTQIRSPVNGIVIKRSVEVGQTVAASLQAPELFVIARNLSDMQVEAAIDEADISRVRDAQKVSFTIDAFPGRSFDGTVKQVRKAAVSAQNVVSYTVVVGFANPGSLMLPGMTANVRIITETRDNVLKLPNAALRVRIAGIEPEAAASGAAEGSTPVRRGAAAAFGGLPTALAQGGRAASAPPAATASANAGGGPAGGPQRELRRRLIDELGLSAAQQEQVDAVFAAQRSRFAELRNLGEAERPKARERIMADMRAQLSERLTTEQNARYQKLQLELAGRQNTRGRIYLPDAGGKPRAYSVRLGISDGVMTELIVPPNSPEASVLVEGATVITAVLSSGASAAGATRGAGAPAGPRPF
jgi:HlyD family secretion protein